MIIFFYILLFSHFPKSEFAEFKYLEKIGEVSFPLDNETGFRAFTLQYWKNEKSGKNYLCIMNFPARKYNLKFYDYDNQQLDFLIDLHTEGPNGTGIYPFGFYIHNLDSIFVFSDREGQLSLIDKNGTVKSKYQILDTSKGKVPQGFVSTSHPIIFNSDEIIINGWYRWEVQDQTKVKQDIRLNLKTGKYDYIVPRPKLYNRGFWGSHYLTRIYHCYNNKNETLLVSFGADPNIYEYAINDLKTYRTIECKSKYLGNLKPLGSKRMQYSEDSKFRYEGLSGSYGYILYDPYQKLYYRFVQIPVSTSKYKFSSTPFKGYSLIIMDSHFNIIGEDLIPDDYDPYMVFISEKGLHLANKSLYNYDEDHLVFDIFKMKEK